MKTFQFLVAVPILLAAAACHRQAGNASAADPSAPAADSLAAGHGETWAAHDAQAMTSIDVATGDLSGFAGYAGGRAFAPPALQASAASGASAAAPAMPTAVIDGSVAETDEGVSQQAGGVPSSAIPGPAAASNPTGSRAQPAQ